MTEPIKARISSDMERFVSEELEMLLPSEHPPPLGVNLLVVTVFGKLLIGKWGDDCCEWHPLPKRNTKHKQQGECV